LRPHQIGKPYKKISLYPAVILCGIAAAHLAQAQTSPAPTEAAAPADAQGPIRVTVDSAPVAFRGQQPVQRGAHILVPLRGVFEKMGAQVKYDASTKTVNAKSDRSTMALTVGSTEAQVDGKTVTLDTPPTMTNGSVLVPIRFVSENLGSAIHFDKPTRTVVIDTTKTPAPSSGSITGSDAAGTTPASGAATPTGGAATAVPAAQPAAPTVIVNNAAPATPAPATPAAPVAAPTAPPPAAAVQPAPAAPVAVAPADTETGLTLAKALPWIIGALALAGLAAFFLNRKGKTGQVIAADDQKRP